ncbi:transcription antitermination protein NusB [Candidatus Collierbacteria bacterium]|nr:transcription antitermination protein NusB [Candidatus Collierbacteria bacterium]
MKTKTDKRHLKRKRLVEEFFSGAFHNLTNHSLTAKKILNHIDLIESLMTQAAVEGKTRKINKVDKAVLIVSIWELAIEKRTPPKVIIDEAVELAKEFGSESSPGFVNGILGAILKKLK